MTDGELADRAVGNDRIVDIADLRRRIEGVRRRLSGFLLGGLDSSGDVIHEVETSLAKIAFEVDLIGEERAAVDLRRRLSRMNDDLQRCKIFQAKFRPESVRKPPPDSPRGSQAKADIYGGIAEAYAANARSRHRGGRPTPMQLVGSGQFEPQKWLLTDSSVAKRVTTVSASCLAAYRANPRLVEEHANIERDAAEGGYGKRQVYELIQNGADALVDTLGGRITVILGPEALYCANEGRPIDVEGVDALLSSHLSRKRGHEIGRWGLGFKSVLGVTKRPEFYSRSGSFGFSAEASADAIGRVVARVEKTPILRIAEPLDARAAAEGDSILRELMGWAATVVKLPLAESQCEWLASDLADFPAEFLLFSSHVGALSLEDRRNGMVRHISLEVGSQGVAHLSEGSTSGSWRVFRKMYRPSPAAIKDGGDLVARDEVPIAWAVPTKGRLGRGKFWAFFPTKDETLLSGILNAPWKTHSDRHNLLEGLYNREILQSAVAPLVVESLGALLAQEDPGRVLDYLPGRKDESPNWADRVLHDSVYQLASQSPSLPDQRGILVEPASLFLHPSGLGREVLDLWSAAAMRPVDWCHPSVESRERRPRVESLLATAWRTSSSLEEWLEALVVSDPIGGSQAAIEVAAKVLAADPSQKERIRRSDFVLTEGGTLVPPVPNLVFFAGSYVPENSNLFAVSSQVLSKPLMRRYLEELGLREIDAGLELRAWIQRLHYSEGEDWERFWTLTRRLSFEEAAECFADVEVGKIHVRTVAGTFSPLNQCLLPGSIVPADGSRDGSVAIDPRFHKPDEELLRRLGAVSSPIAERGDSSEPWFWNYRKDAIDTYIQGLKKDSSRPQRGYLDFLGECSFCGPLVPMTLLSDEGRARFTEAVLDVDGDSPDWRLGHQTRPDTYPELWSLPPSLWAVKKEGRLTTTLGLSPVSRSVSRSLREWGDVLPVSDLDDEMSKRLGMATTLAELRSDVWTKALGLVDRLPDNSSVGRLYAIAADAGVKAPVKLICRIENDYGTEVPTSVTVAHTLDQFEALLTQATPVVLVSAREQADTLVRLWGLKPAESSVSGEVSCIPVLESQLVDIFPALRWRLDPERSPIAATICESLKLDVLTRDGRTSVEKSFLFDGSTMFWIQSMSDREVLERVNAELSLALTEDDILQIADHRQSHQRRVKVAAVRRRPDLAGRLQEALGVPAIRRRLPAGLLEAVEAERGSLTEQDMADLAVAVYGVEVLRTYRTELEEAGLAPPSQWGGGRPARRFVKDLGFPIEFAGFENSRRDPLLKVAGPPNLKKLHDFQQSIASSMKRLIREKDPSRGILSLPTGAGKTRVAVQSIVELIRDEEFRGPILWVAQNDELCEQAVQSWYDVWRAVGARGELFISRLWGPNEAEESDNAPQVVVATIQKLQGRFDDEAYGWLKSCSVVVIDEAHGSTEPMYTRLLDWIGLSRGKGDIPLIGLTATPFRGVSKEETERLVARYGRHRLDLNELGDDPYRTLQDKGVLAHVEQRLIDGSAISLTLDEADSLKQLRKLPAAAEERLGADTERNRRILKAVLQLPANWPVLLFATSVAHAQVMAALLQAQGVSAAPIWGGTDMGARRHYIEEFRERRIRVLTNYNVLTQGFDAPAVRALCVARPTFSPTVYQQMIGRGLRGPLNGGEETCLIINVEDNVAQFGEELAFRQFEHLWDGRPRL